MNKTRERGNIEKKRRRNIVNLKGRGKRRTGEQLQKEKRKRRTIIYKKDFKGTLVSHTFVFVYLWIFNFSVSDVQVVSFMQY